MLRSRCSSKTGITVQVGLELVSSLNRNHCPSAIGITVQVLSEYAVSFTYFIDFDSFATLKKEILGRQIALTNRHDWSNEEILLAYRGQSKVEYAFRTLKNPYHMAVRPQYHWTDQKIEAHFLMCIIGYLLSVYTYEKVKKFYKRNIGNMLNDLSTIRLACIAKNGKKISYQLEKLPHHLQHLAKTLGISNENIRPKLNFSDYI